MWYNIDISKEIGDYMIDPNNLVKLKHPELKKEWDVDKNHDIEFDLITCGSNKKYWWICSKNHSWQASPNKRCNSGRGCPFCNGNNTILPGENDLQTLFPDIAKEWHPTLNDGLTPDMIRPQSEAKKIWWLCPEGHEYQAMASSRTRATNSTGCPICQKENKTSLNEKIIFYYISKVFSDTVSTYKLDRKDIDVFIPHLDVGIEYDGQGWHQEIKRDLEKDIECDNQGIKLIRIREPKCPQYESNSIKYVLKAVNEEELSKAIEFILGQIDSSLLSKADINIQRDIGEINDLMMYMKKSNSIQEKYPQLVAEWHPTKNGTLRPDSISCESHKKVWWLGKCGHEWNAEVRGRTKKEYNCPICAGKIVLEGFNDLTTVRPDLAKEWDVEKNNELGLKATEVTKGSNKKAWWICSKCGNNYKQFVYSRTCDNQGCPICGKTLGEKHRMETVKKKNATHL